MSKVALYFRRWKNYSRQKNFDEDWAFSRKLTDLSENIDETEKGNEFPDLEIFQVKFLGCTNVDVPKSEKATAQAIKRVISAAKTTNKKLQRLNLSVCPKGIETFDAITGETLHQISIYKISYCSADAAHSNVFAFIAGSSDAHDRDKSPDDLVCYAFLCGKRRIAYNLTVTVAKNFERAFELWKRSKHLVEQREEEHSINVKRQTNSFRRKENHGNDPFSDLIDFNASSVNNATAIERRKQLLQTTWVSFEETALYENSDDNFTLGNSL